MAIKGITQKTSDKLYELTNKKPNKNIELHPQKSNKNDSYKNSRDSLLKKYLEREPYDFNINTDKLYAQYADQYKRQGEAAMRDTVADAATKTGGYTSSYGITAGSQAYQGYLDKLNDILPELEAKAYDRYTEDAERTESKLDILDSYDSKEYDSYRDSVSDYKEDRDYYRSVYEYDNDADLELYKLLTNYVLSVAELENKDYTDNKDRELALMKIYADQK